MLTRVAAVVVVWVALAGRGWAQSGEPVDGPADEPGMAPPTAPAPAPAPVPPAPESAPSKPATPAAPARPAAAAAADIWYYAAGGEKAGPFTTQQMQSLIATGLLDAHTPVWQPGEKRWRPLGEMAELALTLSADKGKGRQPIRGLIIGGSILFGITWSLAVIASAGLGAEESCSDCKDVAKVLWIPVLGPVLTNVVADDSGDGTMAALTTIWTLAQAAGATMLFFGAYGRKPKKLDVNTAGILPGGFRVAPLFGRIKGLGLSRAW